VVFKSSEVPLTLRNCSDECLDRAFTWVEILAILEKHLVLPLRYVLGLNTATSVVKHVNRLLLLVCFFFK
jgi:hypothetical protein